MNVGSFLEIYTTMFGWAFYDTLYDLFNATGILYLPFLMVLYRNWRDPYLSQDDKPAAVTSQRRMTWGMISMVMVFSLSVLPFKQMQLNQVRYVVACTDNAGNKKVEQNVQGGNTNTTFDAALAGANVTRIPILWWLTLSISSGINYAATSSFRCFEDIKGLDQQLRNLTIKDQGLREEYTRFANECFLPSKSKYLRALRGGEHNQYVTNTMNQFLVNNKEYDASDPYFIGSHYYLQTFGFYRNNDKQNSCATQPGGCGFQAAKSVPGWPYVDHRDNDAALQAANQGRPYCDEWWADGQLGLEKKLLDSVEASKVTVAGWDDAKSFFTNVKNIIAAKYVGIVYTNDQIEDLIIKNYVSQDPPDMLGGQGDNNFFDPNPMTFGQALDGLGLAGIGAAAVGAAGGAATGAAVTGTALNIANAFAGFYTTMFVIKTAAPMFQAVLLMMIYMLLLIYLVVSEYDVDAVITALFLVLAVRFFTPLWAMADYLDSQLFVAMYPDATFLGSVFTHGMERLLLDMVLTVLYVVAPALLLAMMAMAGQKLGRMGGMADGGMGNTIGGVGSKVGSSIKK